jgi:pyruvate,water dikinase
VADQTARLADEFGAPVDLEWVWDGSEVWWAQLRPITGLEDVTVYSNRISREVMPGMIKPLVWSVNVPVVNRAWIELFGEVIGPNDLTPEQLARQFAYRSYFNMGTIGEIFERLGMPRDGLELLLGLPSDTKPGFRPGAAALRHLPRFLATLAGKARYGGRVGPEIESLRERFADLGNVELETLSDTALLQRIDDLSEVTTRAAYANIVTPLLANGYLALLRRSLRKHGIDPHELDLGLGDPENPFDPIPALGRLGRSIAAATPDAAEVLHDDGLDGLPVDARRALDEFLERFGHLSDSGNDFSVPAWTEQPELVARMALDHAEAAPSRGARSWRDTLDGLGPLARRSTRFFWNRASAFADHREHVSFVYTYGYGLFRPLFLEAGRRLLRRGMIDDPEDIMYLDLTEVRAALIGSVVDPGPSALVEVRRTEMAEFAGVDMPDTIFGEDFVPARVPAASSGHLEGVATSRGRHRGRLKVVTGIADSPRVEVGDVIAIPFSDVGWTPLLARAGAVVAEAGGMLSHSSIVAREYRIPCVVSVPGATRLPDGAMVVVDGYTGTVIVESPEED